MSAALQRVNHADQPQHLIIIARAGTGKTTTLVEGLRIIRGEKPNVDPSPQQATIWAKMRTGPQPKNVCFVAFNRGIKEELARRIPPDCRAMTMHGMGYGAVRRAFPDVKLNDDRVDEIIEELTGRDIWNLRKQRPTFLAATRQLVGYAKMNLVGVHPHHLDKGYAPDVCYDEQGWDNVLADLASYYDVDLNGEQRAVFSMVPHVLERCKDVSRDGCIDFADMIWIPVALDLPMWTYDLLLVDEAQDLNRCLQTLAFKAIGDRGRLILCGDDRQAIYGFAGADCESLQRMEATLRATTRGVKVLPLTVTRRCGKAIVAEAQKYVPDFEAHESNGEGSVRSMGWKSVWSKQAATEVEDGDMILCRVNAPLVSECFKFLAQGRKANIQGRKVGEGLIAMLKRSKATQVESFVGWLDEWHRRETQKENKRRYPSEARLIALDDRRDCLMVFCENEETTEAVIDKVNSVFTDDKDSPGIMLSSVHKAKGLEADRVFILQPEGAGMPHPMARTKWQRDQEFNLLYVAITRAKKELVYVS
jgi:superfamily I DNA/RNA helicase